MIIAAHIFAASCQESFLYNCFLPLAKEQPANHFLLFVDKHFYTPDNLPVNIERVDIKPSLKNGLTLHYWYNFKLPSLLKKYEVTHFISESNVLSLRTTIRQFLLIRSMSFLLRKPVVMQEHARYLKRYFAKFLQKAAGVWITEKFLGESLLSKYPAIKEKITYTGHGLNEVFQPIDWEQKEKFLETFSSGTEYFIAECSPVTQANIFSLLKAFSLFKQRQKSAMQLVLLVREIELENCVKDFHLYKYREDVKIISYTNDTSYATMLCASYAAVYLPLQVVTENTGLNALASGIPLITLENTAALSIYGDAALYAGFSEKLIAESMMLLYKDEVLRKKLIEKGLHISYGYNWLTSATKIWQAIKVG